MESTDISLQEKLDQMLREGKIGEEDYQRLLETMTAEPGEEAEPSEEAPPPRKLFKNWKDRQLGGVCAGLADHLGVDRTIVRIAAAVLLLVAPPAVLLAYVLMYYLLPWDDEAAAFGPLREGHPWRFGFYAVLLLTILPCLSSAYLGAWAVDTCRQLDAPLSMISQITHHVGLIYQQGAWVLSLIGAATATIAYLLCHKKSLRRVYTIAFFSCAGLWALFLVVGTVYALLAMPFGTL